MVATNSLNVQFLSDLARGGFAERMTEEQRRDIHVKTDLDSFIEDSLDEGKQIVLTGNPGDGKTQYIYMKRDKYPDYFYLMDASEYRDYRELLDEWEMSYDQGEPGILAINDGPLFEMTANYSDEYEFLPTVQRQFQSQIVYDDSEASDVDFSKIVVIDLNNRNVLTRKIVLQVIKKLTDEKFLENHDHTGACHIQYNIQKLRNENVQENVKELLKTVGRTEDHVTVRDLINFVAYCITGGESECLTEFDEDMKYHNLAFDGEGKIFDLLNRHFSPTDLTHPFVDSKLWSQAEENVSPRDSEDLRESISEEFLNLKRRFYFEDNSMDVDYSARDVYHEIDYSFHNNRNSSNDNEEAKEDTIRKINGYFMPTSSERRYLNVWMSHRYRSRSSRSLISRTQVRKSDLSRKTPRLHPDIRDALAYVSDHYVLEYQQEHGSCVRLEINQDLSRALSALDANTPYRIRDQETEQQLLEFMEEIEYLEEHSASTGEISIKDTETEDIETVEVEDKRYRIG